MFEPDAAICCVSVVVWKLIVWLTLAFDAQTSEVDACTANVPAFVTACDGTDASCLRVSKRLYKNHDGGFVDAGFNGDTLIYGENPYAGDATGSFVGVLSAWRPGWAAGRALTSELGVACVGQAGSVQLNMRTL